MECTKGNLKFVYSPKYPGAVFLKVRGTRERFVCKVYTQKNPDETIANANRIKQLWDAEEERRSL